MGQDPKKKQKAKQKKIAKAKKKEKQAKNSLNTLKNFSLKEATDWPIYDCWLSTSWKNTKELTLGTIARQSAKGQVVAVSFLIDQACLGVKQTKIGSFPTIKEYQSEFLEEYLNGPAKIEKCNEYELFAKVVRKAIEYAENNGFPPDSSCQKAIAILANIEDENCAKEIPLGGENGKPLFVQGPYDKVDFILKTLDKNLGRENFDFILPVSDGFE